MHLSTEEPAASRMLEPFGEVGGDVPEYFSSRTHFAKIEDKKILRKIKSKNLTAGVKFSPMALVCIVALRSLCESSMFSYVITYMVSQSALYIDQLFLHIYSQTTIIS